MKYHQIVLKTIFMIFDKNFKFLISALNFMQNFDFILFIKSIKTDSCTPETNVSTCLIM